MSGLGYKAYNFEVLHHGLHPWFSNSDCWFLLTGERNQHTLLLQSLTVSGTVYLAMFWLENNVFNIQHGWIEV